MTARNDEEDSFGRKMEIIDGMVMDLTEIKNDLIKVAESPAAQESHQQGSSKVPLQVQEEIDIASGRHGFGENSGGADERISLNDFKKAHQKIKKLKAAALTRNENHLVPGTSRESASGSTIQLEININGLKKIIDDLHTDKAKREEEIIELKNNMELLKHEFVSFKAEKEKDVEEPASKKRRIAEIGNTSVNNDNLQEELSHLKAQVIKQESVMALVNAPVIYGLKKRITQAIDSGKWEDCKQHLERYLRKNTPEYIQLQKVKASKNHLPLVAAEEGFIELINVLLVNGLPINQGYSKQKNFSMLLYAASCGRSDLADFLISKGAGLNIGNFWNWTPLMYAASSGHANVVSVLITHGVDVNEKDESETSALCWAIRGGHVSVVKCLLDGGCDKTGALDVAIEERDLSKKAGMNEEAQNAIVELLSEE